MYDSIVQNARKSNRKVDSTTYECHHILPRSLGGDDNPENLVLLTFREHYLAHTLLPKFTIGKDKMKMCFALHTFFHFSYDRRYYKIHSRLYEAHKKMFVQACKDRQPYTDDAQHIFKHRKSLDEFKGTKSEFRVYSGLSPQEIYNITSNSIRHSKGWGIFLDEEGVFSYEKKINYTPLENKVCEHCSKSVSPGNYTRWHGDNCKVIDKEGHDKRTKQIANLANIR